MTTWFPVGWYGSELQVPAWPVGTGLGFKSQLNIFLLLSWLLSLPQAHAVCYSHLSNTCSCRSSKNSSPKRGRVSPPRGNLSPKRDVSPKPSRAGTLKGPFVLSPNPSAFSLSTLPSALQAGDAGRVAPLPGVGDFPELAAMEADFQRNLARGVVLPLTLPVCLNPCSSDCALFLAVLCFMSNGQQMYSAAIAVKA